MNRGRPDARALMPGATSGLPAVLRDAASPPARQNVVQVLRGIAACMVVLLHLEMVRVAFTKHTLGRLPKFLKFGYAGVELFFIISGYIIMYITDGKTFDPREFLLKRFFRIYPIYMAFTLVPVVALFLAPALRREGMPSIFEIVASFSIFPQYGAPILGPGWSLEHEIIFYLIVAAFLTAGLRRWIVPVLLACTGVGVMIHGILPLLGYPDMWDWQLFSPFQFGFAVGASIYAHREKLVGAGTLIPLMAGAVMTCATAAIVEPFRSAGVWSAQGAHLLIEVFGFTSGFALIFVAMLNMGRWPSLARLSRPVAGLILVGDASYVLYLCNYLLLAFAMKALPHFKLPSELLWVYMALAFVVCVAVAIAIHLWIERPYLRMAGKFGTKLLGGRHD